MKKYFPCYLTQEANCEHLNLWRPKR